MGTAIVIALMLLALISLIISAATALGRSPATGREGPGWFARLMCPRSGEQTAVRIGPDLVANAPAVLWCERFADGPLACGRECFTALGAGEDPHSLMEPAQL